MNPTIWGSEGRGFLIRFLHYSGRPGGWGSSGLGVYESSNCGQSARDAGGLGGVWGFGCQRVVSRRAGEQDLVTPLTDSQGCTALSLLHKQQRLATSPLAQTLNPKPETLIPKL